MDFVINRMTKIHFVRDSECGDIKIATNNLSLFPYFKENLENSTRKNSNFMWHMGLQPRNKHITDPEVLSIRA